MRTLWGELNDSARFERSARVGRASHERFMVGSSVVQCQAGDTARDRRFFRIASQVGGKTTMLSQKSSIALTTCRNRSRSSGFLIKQFALSS